MTHRWLVAACAILLPGLVLLPAWQLGGLGAREDDILYYYPSRVWFGEMIRAGEAPFLNPWTGLDRPFLADPQSAVFYPTTWLFAVLPPAVAYGGSLWLHYSLALWGMYRLLRALKLDLRAALLGGIAFAFCGFMLAHRAHFALQHAAAWTPLVFWRLLRLVERPGGRRLAFAAGAAALQSFAGHIQIAAITALGSLVWLVALRFQLRRVVIGWGGAWVLAGGLFAVQIVPTLLHLRECTRGQRGYMDFVENSWYPQSVVGWFLPMFTGQRTPNFFDERYWGPSHQVEQFSYGGIGVLVLAAAAIFNGWRGERRRRAWVMLAIFSLLLALGLFGPICPLLYWLPGANLFRVPARALLLVNLVGAALAAGVLHDLSASRTPQRARLRALLLGWTRRPVVLTLVVIASTAAVTAMIALLLPADVRSAALASIAPWRTGIWVSALVMVVTVAMIGWIVRGWDQPWRAKLLIPLLVVDLGIIGWTIDVPVEARGPGDLLDSPGREELREYLRGGPGLLWVVTGRHQGVPGEYVDSIDKLAANTNILAHVPTLTDYGPLQPRFVPAMLQFKPWGEAERAIELLQASDWMRAVGVQWVLLCEPDLPAPSGTLVATLPKGYRLFRVADDVSPVVVKGLPANMRIELIDASATQSIVRVFRTDETIGAVSASKKARVTIPRLAWSGWSATIGANQVPVERTSAGFISFEILPDREHSIGLAYWPPGLVSGAGVTILSMLVWIYLVFASDRSVWIQRAFGGAGVVDPDSTLS